MCMPAQGHLLCTTGQAPKSGDAATAREQHLAATPLQCQLLKNLLSSHYSASGANHPELLSKPRSSAHSPDVEASPVIKADRPSNQHKLHSSQPPNAVTLPLSWGGCGPSAATLAGDSPAALDLKPSLKVAPLQPTRQGLRCDIPADPYAAKEAGLPGCIGSVHKPLPSAPDAQVSAGAYC